MAILFAALDSRVEGDVGVSEALANKICAVPGVAALSTLRYPQTLIPTRRAGIGTATFGCWRRTRRGGNW